MSERPTSAEKADAASRFVDALDEAHAALSKAYQVTSECTKRGDSHSTPLFPFIGDSLRKQIGVARDVLWAMKDKAAVQNFDESRIASRQTRATE